MKIVYLHQYFKYPDSTGGTRSYDLAKYFSDNNIMVEVIAATNDIKYCNTKSWCKVSRDNIIVNYLYIPYGNHVKYIRRIYQYIYFAFKSSIKILQINGDLTIATSTPLTVGIPAILAKYIKKRPYIFEIRDVWPEAVVAIQAIKNKYIIKALCKIEKYIYDNAIALVPLSSDMKQSIISRYPKMIYKPISIIENIAETKRFALTSYSRHNIIVNHSNCHPRHVVLYAGTLGKVNNLDYVIEFLNELVKIDSSIVFVIMGRGSCENSIREKAIKYSLLGNNVIMPKPVSKNKLSEWYGEADMGSSFVAPIKELWSNSANKFFDTLAAGKPILINYEGWQKKVILDYNVGYVLPYMFDKNDVIKFVEYTYNYELIKKQRSNAIRLAKSKYSLEVQGNKYIKLISELSQK